MSGARRAVIPSPDLEPAAIRAALGRIDPVFTNTPQYVHEGLSARLGVPVIVKVETDNPIRSFKGRGTWIAMAGLAGEGSIAADRPWCSARRAPIARKSHACARWARP